MFPPAFWRRCWSLFRPLSPQKLPRLILHRLHWMTYFTLNFLECGKTVPTLMTALHLLNVYEQKRGAGRYDNFP